MFSYSKLCLVFLYLTRSCIYSGAIPFKYLCFYSNGFHSSKILVFKKDLKTVSLLLSLRNLLSIYNAFNCRAIFYFIYD